MIPPETTQICALWGALVGTASLVWNVWSWSRSRPKVDVTATLIGEGDEAEITYEIRNRGGQPTTLEEIRLVTYGAAPLRWIGMFSAEERVSNKHRMAFCLPVPLAPGGLWKGAAPLVDRSCALDSTKEGLIRKGALFCRVRLTHSSRWVETAVRTGGLLPFTWAA
jgi:hypothetical protein